MANGSVAPKDEHECQPDDPTPTQQREDLNENRESSGHVAASPQAGPRSPASVAELQERAVQDSANNNVDENSNDNHFDFYSALDFDAVGGGAAAARVTDDGTRESPSNEHFGDYGTPRNAGHRTDLPTQPGDSHRNTSRPRESSQSQRHSQDVPPSSHSSYSTTQFDQSVRPRVRHRQPHGDQPDCTPPHQRACMIRRDSFGCNMTAQHNTHKHRRNHSEGTSAYPPLPNINYLSSDSRELPPHQDGYGAQSHTLPRLLPPSARDEDPNANLSLAVRSSVTQEAEELLTAFTSETLRNNSLEVPHWMAGIPSNPQMVRAGRELRLLADAFACTAERRKVRDMAESVNLDCIDMEDFFHLCAELFYDGITRERIVALFTFVGDVAVHQVKLRGEELIRRLMKWSLRYIVEHVCRWVQEAGGWVAVLSCGATFLYRCAVFAFCVCGSVAAGLFIYKTLRNG